MARRNPSGISLKYCNPEILHTSGFGIDLMFLYLYAISTILSWADLYDLFKARLFYLIKANPKSRNLDISSLNTGIYIVIVKTDGGISFTKTCEVCQISISPQTSSAPLSLSHSSIQQYISRPDKRKHQF